MFLDSTTINPKILLVDDETIVIHQLNSLLGDLGDIRFAQNGKLAFEMAKEYKPDLILLDIEMPDMNGYEVCRLIKSHSELASTSIIFVTSHSNPAVEQIAFELGGLDFIPKPIVPEIARVRVKNQLALSKQRQQLQQAVKELRFLVSTLPVFVSYWDESFTNLFCNDFKGVWFGLDAGKMKGKKLDDVVGGDVAKIVKHQLGMMDSSDSQLFDIHFNSPQNGLVFGQVALAKRDSENNSKGVLLVITDITKRKLAEQQLEDEKERIKVTLNSIGDAVIATDAQGMITLMNPVAEDLTGFTTSEAQGFPIEQIMRLKDGDNGEDIQNPIRRALKERQIVGMAHNTHLFTRDGNHLEVEDSASPIVDNEGNLTGAVIVFHDVSEVKAMSLRMTYLAQHDLLTDLPNRVLLYDRTQQAINNSRRDDNIVAMFLLDIDHFKEVNEIHGHSVGDRLIQQIAKALQMEVRDSDTLCRQGGDEFIFLFPGLDTDTYVTLMADRLLNVFNRIWKVDEHVFNLTVSIGISLCPVDSQDLESLYRHADAAMYSAKQAGRNRYHFYSAEIEAKLVLKRMLERHLEESLTDNVFEVYYQPKINVVNDQIVGVEALVRWRQPDGTIANPSSFIPLAEETGLIIPLGKLILRQAFSQARTWQQQGFDLRVAVNISIVQFEADDFLFILDELIVETGISPSSIELEITESMLAKNVDAAKLTLIELKRRGFQIALDDFGTGYSSLSYLKNFPFDVLKIDQSFVRNMLASSVDQQIIRAIVQLAQGLKLRLIAEGVETVDHVHALISMGCEIMQGFYYSRPVPVDKINYFLAKNIVLPDSTEGA